MNFVERLDGVVETLIRLHDKEPLRILVRGLTGLSVGDEVYMTTDVDGQRSGGHYIIESTSKSIILDEGKDAKVRHFINLVPKSHD